MFSIDHAAVNPWKRQDDNCLNSSRRLDEEESRGLLAQEANGFTNYQSRPAFTPESEAIPNGFLSKTFWQRLVGLCIAIGALVLVIELSKAPRKTLVHNPVLAEVAKSPEKCVTLGPVGSQILPWIQAISGRKLGPRSCWTAEAGTTLSCPGTFKPSVNSTAVDSEDSSTSNEPAVDERRLLVTNTEERSEDEIVCEGIVHWTQGLENMYDTLVTEAVEKVIRILDGSPEAVDSELVELQMFGLPQIQQFEKFKFHHGWFKGGETKIESFGAFAGFGFQVYCGRDLILEAGGGTGGEYSELQGFRTGWGGSVAIKGASIGTKLFSSDLPTFYEHFEDTVAEIQNCSKLTVLGGSGWAGGLDLNARGYLLGYAGESFALGPIPARMTAFEGPESTSSFQRWFPNLGGFDIPIKYSDVVSTKNE